MSLDNEQQSRYADLHLHTNTSDGSCRPFEVVDMAAELGFSAIAISDHDSVSGIDEALERAKERGLELIPAIELSAELNSQEIHILGYFFDHHNRIFEKKLEKFRDYRQKRVRVMIAKLQGTGIEVDLEEFMRQYQNQSIGRLHLAQYLVSKGFVRGIKEAFNRYLGFEKPAYASKYNLSPSKACQLIREAGGISVLAHPHLLRKDEMIPKLVEDGIEGLEAYYSYIPESVIDHYRQMAKDLGVLVSGGSDCHQHNKEQLLIGGVRLPYSYVDEMKQYLRQEPKSI